MIGSIIGDIVGSIFEFTGDKNKPETLMFQESKYTDDSLCSIIVADIIMNNKPVAETMQTICRQFPRAGFGGMFFDWIFTDNSKPYNSYGNGSVMRISSIPYLTNSLEECLQKGIEITEITHNHEYSFKAVECYLTLVYKALKENYTKEQLIEIAVSYYPEISNFTMQELHDNYQFNETCQGSLPQALFAFFESTDYESCLYNAIHIGGDTDTTACIAGGLAEAYYKNIPHYLIDGMYEKFNNSYYLINTIESFLLKSLEVPSNYIYKKEKNTD